MSFNINLIINIADNTTVVGLIRDKDETAYRKEQYRDAVRKMLIKKDSHKTVYVCFEKGRQAPPYATDPSVTLLRKRPSVEFLGFHVADNLPFTTKHQGYPISASKNLQCLKKVVPTATCHPLQRHH